MVGESQVVLLLDTPELQKNKGTRVALIPERKHWLLPNAHTRLAADPQHTWLLPLMNISTGWRSPPVCPDEPTLVNILARITIIYMKYM